MNFNQAKIISVYYNKGDRKPYDVNGKPIAYIGEEFIGSTEATTIRFYLGEDIDSSTALITTKRADGEVRLDFCSKVGTGVDSYYEVTLNGWYSAVKGKAVVVFKAYNGTVTLNEDGDEILSATGRIVVSDIFNLNVAYAPNATIGVPPDDPDPEVNWYFALSTKLDKADSITVAGALPTLTGDVYDDRYFYIEDEGVGKLFYINGSTAEEVVFGVGTLKLTSNGNEDINVGTNAGKMYWDEERGTIIAGLYDELEAGVGDSLFFFGKATEAIAKGEVVQFAGNTGGNIRLKKAVFSEISAQPDLLMGVAKHAIATNDFGYVASFGYVRNLNTSAFTTPILYLSTTTPGALSSTKPITGFKGSIAAVARPSTGGGSDGFIIVRPNLVKGVGELADVTITSATSGNVLSYDGTKWVNSTRLTTAETDIANIEDGTTIVAKANADKDGNEFDATYLKKASASSIYVPLSQKGATNGVATLGSDGRVPSSQLPASIGEVIEFPTLADFPEEGTAERIYIALDTNLAYRWSGTQYSEISPSIALGETSSTAFAGNRGVALETLTDNIVDGTQTLSDTRITNSAIGIRPLTINAITGTEANIQEWQVNGSIRARLTSGGLFGVNNVFNVSSLDNSRIELQNEGARISRNIADANPSLIVNQANAGSTGDILRLQSAGANVLEVTRTGGLNQNGTRLFSNPGTQNTFFGEISGGANVTGSNNSGFGRASFNNLSTGSDNTAVGRNALVNVTTGSGNTGVGTRNGSTITTGTNNTFVGFNAGNNDLQLATASNSTALGNGSYTDKSNQMVYGNASVTEHVFNRNTGALMLLPQINASSANASILERTSSGTNSALNPLIVKQTTSGDMVDGFGTDITFQIRDNANVDNSIAIIRALRTGADNSGRLAFRTSTTGTSTEKMTILNDGKVGIGTSSPAQFLTVVSQTNFDGIQIRRNSATTNDYARLGFRISTSDGDVLNAEIRTVRTDRVFTTDSDLSFFTRSSNTVAERLRIRDDGLVGINETTLSAQLQVKSGATTRVPLIVDTLGSHTANLAEYKVDGTTNAFIASDGRLFTRAGISNFSSNNNSRIDLGGSGTLIQRNVADTNPALIVNLANASATGNIQVWQKSGSALATITNGGGATFSANVGIGLTGPTTRLQVKATTSDNSANVLRLQDSNDEALFSVRNDGQTTIHNGPNFTTSSSANVFMTLGGILQRSTSSLRYKEEVEDMTYGIEDVMKLRPVTYKGKATTDGDKRFGGFIAEEVDEIGLKEFVEYDEENKPNALHYAQMVSLLVKAIQEQQKEINKLKAKIG
jgi:hypothetical protein